MNQDLIYPLFFMNFHEYQNFKFLLWVNPSVIQDLPMVVATRNSSTGVSTAEPPRWVIGTGQLSRLRFRAGPIARRGAA